MFIAGRVFSGDIISLFLFSVIIFLAINLAHSWLIGPLFIKIGGSRVIGSIFCLAYLGLSVWLCIHLTNLLKNSDVLGLEFGIFISLLSVALSGAHTFSMAFYSDNWEEIDYLDWEEKSGLNFWWAVPTYIASLLLHPIAVCVLFVIAVVVVAFITTERY